MVLAVIMIAAAVLIIIKCLGNKEEFASTRAYRTADELFENVMIDGEEPVVIDRDPYDMILREEAAAAYEIMNDERIAVGLSPLMWDAHLEYGAVTRATELSAFFDKDHMRPNGSYWFTIDPAHVRGENIYKGKGNAAGAMKSWLNSPIDRENFMCPEFTKCAIIVYKTDAGEYFWSALFADDTP